MTKPEKVACQNPKEICAQNRKSGLTKHTAKRIYDRLVEERGFTGSYSTVRRFVAEFRRERSSGAGEGFDLCQDFGHGIERNHAAIGIASDLGSGRSKKASLGSVRSKKSAMASAGTL